MKLITVTCFIVIFKIGIVRGMTIVKSYSLHQCIYFDSLVEYISIVTLPIFLVSSDCVDRNIHCASWERAGECSRNPAYMLENCKKSCSKDGNQHCPSWAAAGECSKNPEYMLKNCQKSCGHCGRSLTFLF